MTSYDLRVATAPKMWTRFRLTLTLAADVLRGGVRLRCVALTPAQPADIMRYE